MEYLPNTVLNIAHILPTYYYISNNEKIAKLEIINIETIIPFLINTGIVIAFCIGFVILTNIVSKRKRKIA